MKKYYGKITVAAIVLVIAIGLVCYIAQKSFAALTTNPILLLTNQDLADHTVVYVILYSTKTGYAANATTGALASNTSWADATLTLTKDSTFKKWNMKVPTTLPAGTYLAQPCGSTDATGDNADTILDWSFQFEWNGSKVVGPLVY